MNIFAKHDQSAGERFLHNMKQMNCILYKQSKHLQDVIYNDNKC